MNKIHRRALHAKLNTSSGTLDELLSQSGSVPIHTRNLKLLVTEVFKSLNHFNPEIMWNIFHVKPSNYSLRPGSSIVIPQGNSSRLIDSFAFRASLAWNHLPLHLKTEKFM